MTFDEERDYLRYPKSTACKHGSKSCLLCGTSAPRDVVHTTHNGRGCVADLRKK